MLANHILDDALHILRAEILEAPIEQAVDLSADVGYQAFDVETGEVLWKTRLAASAHGYPITYEAGGRQFIAVPAALGGVFRSLTANLSPEIYQPEGGNALFVFALPE